MWPYLVQTSSIKLAESPPTHSTPPSRIATLFIAEIFQKLGFVSFIKPQLFFNRLGKYLLAFS